MNAPMVERTAPDSDPRALTTAIQILLDRSGSMSWIKDSVIEGLDAFVTEQLTIPGECTMRLCQFDTDYQEVYPSTPITDVPSMELVPRGYTALRDAWGRAMTEFAKELSDRPVHPDVVIFIVMTDGYENASREWTDAMVNSMVTDRAAQGWRFLYLGANQDAVAEGLKYGVRREGTMTFAPTGQSAGAAYSAVSCVTTEWRGGGTRGVTEQQRKDVLGA
jgi:hypothetical protein